MIIKQPQQHMNHKKKVSSFPKKRSDPNQQGALETSSSGAEAWNMEFRNPKKAFCAWRECFFGPGGIPLS